MAVAADVTAAERLSRYLRSILTCDVVQSLAADTTQSGFSPPIDLVLVDLDSAGADGIAAIGVARKGTDTVPPIPVVALSRSPERRTEALQAGAAAVLENPPPYDVLRDCVLEVLGKPYTPAKKD
jgi:CheY-like chemotaxis protein